MTRFNKVALCLLAIIPLFILGFNQAVKAHSNEDDSHAHAAVIPASIEQNVVNITTDGQYRYIKSNGLPNHTTGRFPNRSNPNRISSQNHSYRVVIGPKVVYEPRMKDGVIGVALNGIPFEPGTAECWSSSGTQHASPSSTCQWREEAIMGKSTRRLGLDSSNAHVQPNGTYHYHGIPWGLIKVLPKHGDLVHVGYAADGVRIMFSRSGSYKPSYRLKRGSRSGGPGGAHDGTYTADYEYAAAKVGDLDQCNGGHAGGEYVYFVTEGFPYIPRCLMGIADSSFSKRGGSSSSRGGPGHRPPHHRPY